MNGKQLKNSILQLAIQGKLVPQDPNDEPASVLLQRIRKEKERLVKEGKLKKKDLISEPITDEEKPFEIPDSWEWCHLGDIGSWGSGATPSKGKPEYYRNGNIPWLRTGELNNDYVFDSEIKVTQAALDNCSLRMCNKGDVLIAMYGATIGKVAIAGIELTTNQACCACTPILIFNEYLMWYLLASKQSFIELGEGGAQPNISREKIVVFPFAVPPLDEQHRIVSKIKELMPFVEEYDKAQTKLDELNSKLPEALKKSILQQAIQGKLVPQDPNDEPASVLLQRIREEKKRLVKEGKLKKKDLEEKPISEDEIPFDIPESWECVKLSLITSLTEGEKKSGEYVCLDAKFLRGKSIGDKLLKGKFVKKNDTIILVDGENSGEVFTVPCDGYMGSTFKQLWVSETMYLPYVLYFIRYYKDILRNSKKGAAIPHLNKEIFNNLVIGIPPLAEQHRIVEKIEELFAINF